MINESWIKAFLEQGEAGDLGSGGTEIEGGCASPGGSALDPRGLAELSWRCGLTHALLVPVHFRGAFPDTEDGLGGAQSPGVPGNLGF